MKKHIIILAAAITPLAFFSCKKEKIEGQQTDTTSQNEFAFKPVIKPVVDVKSNLVGMYEFDGNLKEQTGHLADAIPCNNWKAVYSDDRKGNANSAIKFTGRYGLDIFKIPIDTNMTVSAWVKYDILAPSLNYFVKADGGSPDFAQDQDTYSGVISTPMRTGVPSGSLSNQWHHLVATYDAFRLKFYVDGSFVGEIVNINNWLPYPIGANIHYQVGYTTPFGGNQILSTWNGSMDDLRFYTRALSAVDVKALYLQ